MTSDLCGSTVVAATAWLMGERMDVRSAPAEQVEARMPLTLRVEPDSLVVLYRYGAAVAFTPGKVGPRPLPEAVRDLAIRPFASPESDDAEIRVAADEPEGADTKGRVVLAEASVERLQVVAEVLARSAFLAHYEARLASSIDRVEPLLEHLRRNGHAGISARRILSELGEALVTEMRMVGRAEVSEKPERTWNRPDLDRLFVHLAEEYELQERDRAVTRKLELLGRSTLTFLEVLQSRRSLNVEWYIVILIVLEIIILVYDLSTR